MKSKLWIGLLFLTGFCIFSYPVLSNYLAEKNQAKIVDLYHEDVADMEEEQIEEEWQRAKAYNRTLKETIIIDPFMEDLAEELDTEYQALLNVNGVMGEIRIPKIDVEIPIYHGTSPEVLQKVRAYLGGSFPVILSMGTNRGYLRDGYGRKDKRTVDRRLGCDRGDYGWRYHGYRR